MIRMLDTNICSYLLRDHPRSVLERFRDLPINQIAVSAVVAAELRFGVAKRQSSTLHEALERFLSGLRQLPWPVAASTHYAELRALLELRGTPIGGMDMLIAAHALAENATLVSNNTRELERVPGLRLENWS